MSALNSLQTNAITLKKTRKERQANVHLNLPITRKYLERSGMSLEDLDQLKIIHVSGTKGKGSTCAFSESILRQSGLKTGFYSSPHLVSVTERIRINGEPIDQVGGAQSSPPVETGLLVCRRSSPPTSGQFTTKFAREKMKKTDRHISSFSQFWPSISSSENRWMLL